MVLLDERAGASGKNITDEQRFSLLLESTTQALWMADADGSISRDSPSWSALTGQASAQQHGWGWLDAIEDADRERLKATLSSALAARSSFRCELGLRRADGKTSS